MILELLISEESLLQVVIDEKRLIGDELVIGVLNQLH